MIWLVSLNIQLVNPSASSITVLYFQGALGEDIQNSQEWESDVRAC